MKQQINKNFDFLRRKYNDNTIVGAILEGSSRSGKTISSIDFIIWLCCNYSGLTINIVRETYNSFKTTLYLDFDRRLKDFGLVSPFDSSKEVASFKLFDNQINFVGADKPSKFEGAGSDYWYFNEMLDIEQIMFDLAEQRCRVFWWGDFNPKATQHWVFDRIMKRDDVAYIHTTFKDNPFISKIERNKILSYEPTKHNIEQGTADDYMWSVYGLGKRCSPTGLIFKDVTWIDTFPEDVERIFFGLDFGFTIDPTALVRVAVKGNNLYLKEELYKPFDNPRELTQVMKPIVKDSIVWCDSADRDYIRDLRLDGISAFKAKKWAGCIMYRIDLMRRFKIHIVKSDNFLIEQENYSYRTIHGIQVNEPIDKFNHLWDAAGYASQHELKNNL